MIQPYGFAFRHPGALLVLLLAVLALSTGSPQPAAATFAGGNGKIAFEGTAGGSTDIFVMNADGTGVTNLTENPAEDFDPVWSPDGTKIAFTSERDANREIYVMNEDGTGAVRLTDDPDQDFRPTWSADGSELLYRHGGDLWIIDAAGGVPSPFAQVGGTLTDPDYSPDGQKIAFADNSDGDFEIYVMNADGTNPVRLVDNTASDSDPSWSPDGTQIMFARFENGSSEVWVMNPDGSGETNITNNPAYDSQPDWSPDGSLIAFYSDRAGGNGDVYVMTPNGSGLERLTTGDGFAPDWQRAALGLQGDADCDDDADAVDSLFVLREVAGLSTAACITRADINCDGDRTAVDALGILRYVAALPALLQNEPCADIGDPLS